MIDDCDYGIDADSVVVACEVACFALVDARAVRVGKENGWLA